MRIHKVRLHNFRSIEDMEVELDDYSLLVGENNSGKTAFLTALRIFYEESGAKFNRSIDFPKFSVADEESWIEIHFETTEEEQALLKDEYRSRDRILCVRRYFYSPDRNRVRPNQSNIYAYENGELSDSLFYGARNISQAKLGTAIFIPEVAKTDETLKLSGPSPFRQMVNFVMKSAVLKSTTFSELSDSFERFNEAFKDEASRSGFSVKTLIDDINEHINHWGIRFGVDVNPISPESIVKNLLSHYIEDEALDGERVNISLYGQGLQRHLIYIMISLSSKYVEPTRTDRKTFSPDFTLILFEEPEAFLHPMQQIRLNASLEALSKDPSVQLLITSHSPRFVCKNVSRLTSVIRLHKPIASTSAFQLRRQELEDLLDENVGLYRKFSDCLRDPDVSVILKKSIRKRCLGDDNPDENRKLEEEAIRYFLWLNAERASIFFSRHVIICEGRSEKALLDCLLDEHWFDLKDKQIQLVDAMGKFCIHRFISLLSAFGISHSVLMDRDQDEDVHAIVNDFIESNRTPHTFAIYAFDKNLENFLGIGEAPRKDLKPLYVISCLRSNQIPQDKLKKFREVVESLLPA